MIAAVGVILTFFSGLLAVTVPLFFARKKDRATTENVEATTETTLAAAANALVAQGMTVAQAAMVTLQQENLGLKAEKADLKAQLVEVLGHLQKVVDENGEPFRVQLEHQAGTLTRLRGQLVTEQQENVRLQSLLEERAG